MKLPSTLTPTPAVPFVHQELKVKTPPPPSGIRSAARQERELAFRYLQYLVGDCGSLGKCQPDLVLSPTLRT